MNRTIHPKGSTRSTVQVNTVFEPAAIQGIRFVAGKQQFVPEVTYPPTQPETDQTSGKQMRERKKKATHAWLFLLACDYSCGVVCFFWDQRNPGKGGKYKLCFTWLKRGKKHLNGRGSIIGGFGLVGASAVSSFTAFPLRFRSSFSFRSFSSLLRTTTVGYNYAFQRLFVILSADPVPYLWRGESICFLDTSLPLILQKVEVRGAVTSRAPTFCLFFAPSPFFHSSCSWEFIMSLCVLASYQQGQKCIHLGLYIAVAPPTDH